MAYWELLPGSQGSGSAYYNLEAPIGVINGALGGRYTYAEITFGHETPGKNMGSLLAVSLEESAYQEWGVPDTACVFHSDSYGHISSGDVQIVAGLRTILMDSEGLPPDCKETLDRMVDYAASISIPGQR